MPSYVLVRTQVHNPEQFEQYRALAGPSVKAHGGRILLKGAVLEALEGQDDAERVAVIEFDSPKVAREWFHSDGYQAAVRARQGVATMRLSLLA